MYHVGIERPSEILTTDFLIVGAGVAGLRAAIEAAEAGDVLVLTKGRLEESATQYAQGGIAAALSEDDELELHEQDTIEAGDGLCSRRAVRTLVEEGPAEIQLLMHWGARFDREGTRLLFAREGAHSRSRVLRAHGDSTGREIVRTLQQRASSLERIRFLSFTAVCDLLAADAEVCGAVALERPSGRLFSIQAKAVLLAAGGLGRVYLETTNPEVATGDGVAVAFRAGAEISDIEFVQFHPTALHLEGAPRFLLSEALRGEGGHLVNARGERFLAGRHALAELAPRDVVSRVIVEELAQSGEPHVYLSLSHIAGIAKRFPRIYRTCLQYGLDLAKQAAPVHPAAHYSMGGIRTDLDGRTTMRRLFAAGEAACTGVHGANRLASNSLLEGLVFGGRAGEAMKQWAAAPRPAAPAPRRPLVPDISQAEIRQLAWSQAGLVRNAGGLAEAIRRLQACDFRPTEATSNQELETRNLHAVLLLIARCALARQESRGCHFRSDFPERRRQFQKHSSIRQGAEVSFREF